MEACLVQWIVVDWGKGARGGRLARRRAEIPLASALPADKPRPADGEILVHQIHYSESDEFETPVRQGATLESLDDTFEIGCLVLDWDAGSLRVRYRWSSEHGGAPRKIVHDAAGNIRPLTRNAFDLAAGEWGRLQYNGRFSWSEGGWYYRRVIANVGRFDRLSADVFTESEPTYRWDSLAKLW